MSNHRRAQTGDTIVEVLIAIAVVGSVLGIAYSIMNRNLIAMRENQERSEAVKLAQGQVEAIGALWRTGQGRADLEELSLGSSFCIDSSNAIYTLPTSAPAINSGDDDFTRYYPEGEPDDGCRFSELYHVGVRYQSLHGNEAFRVYVRWDPLRTTSTPEKNEVIMTYRVK